MKLNYLIISLTLFFFVFNSCKEKDELDDDVPELEVRDALEQDESPFRLSGLTDEIRYIPLETTDSSLLSGVDKLQLTRKHIFVSDLTGLYQFDLSGSFIRQIGGPGKGPGEHGKIIRFSVSPGRGEVYIFSSNIMRIYDIETGAYKREFYAGYDISDFIVLQDYLVLFTHELPSEALDASINEVYIVDTNGDVVDTIPNYDRLKHTNIQSPRGFANVYRKNKDELHYLFNYGDTLYSINSDIERRAYTVFNLDNEITRNDLSIEPIYDEIQYPDFLWIPEISGNAQNLFITIEKGRILKIDPDIEGNIQRILYDKTSGELVPTPGFSNDIDGGLTFWPDFSAENTLVAYYQPYQIIEHYETTAGTDGHSEGFVNLVKSLDENDNPVLVLVETL